MIRAKRSINDKISENVPSVPRFRYRLARMLASATHSCFMVYHLCIIIFLLATCYMIVNSVLVEPINLMRFLKRTHFNIHSVRKHELHFDTILQWRVNPLERIHNPHLVFRSALFEPPSS